LEPATAHDDSLTASLTEDGRFRLLVESITDYAIYMLDRDGHVSSWNPGAERFKGYTAAEIIGKHFSQFYTDEDRAAGIPALALRTAADKGKFEAEGWRVRKDGRRFWAYVVIDPIRTSSGELVGFAKITRDLTERKAAEERLRESQEQFQLLVQGVTDYAIYTLDPNGNINSWNSGAERIKGYKAEEVLNSHFSRFYTEADRSDGEPQKALETARRVGRFEKEGIRVRKDGSQFLAHVILDAIHVDSRLIGFAKITRDITEQHDAKLALDRAREQLFQAQKMDAIGQLTGGVAHDFNNLLTAVLGSLELLRKRLPSDPRMHRLLDNALQGAKRGSALTQRLLAFARRQELRSEVVDILDLVRNMTDLLERSLGGSVPIETRFPLKVPKVYVDPNQLELAVLNLAVNARDAMPEGGTVMIGARPEPVSAGHETGLPAGDYICLWVTDTGEGMDAVTLSQATDPFFTTKGVGKGTGLGLPMVQGVAEQSGGRLLIKSKKGVGTTAEIWLPMARVETLDQSDAAATSGPTPSAAEPLIILAVDDDSLVLNNTAAMLEDLGHTVFEALSGEQALDILRRKQRIDLVITDHVMPEMTGLELAETIRASWPSMPIVIATGFAETPSNPRIELPRLAKPFDQPALAQSIANIMQSTADTTSVIRFKQR
jgi:PAS domain S-box-containing protein